MPAPRHVGPESFFGFLAGLCDAVWLSCHIFFSVSSSDTSSPIIILLALCGLTCICTAHISRRWNPPLSIPGPPGRQSGKVPQSGKPACCAAWLFPASIQLFIRCCKSYCARLFSNCANTIISTSYLHVTLDREVECHSTAEFPEKAPNRGEAPAKIKGAGPPEPCMRDTQAGSSIKCTFRRQLGHHAAEGPT